MNYLVVCLAVGILTMVVVTILCYRAGESHQDIAGSVIGVLVLELVIAVILGAILTGIGKSWGATEETGNIQDIRSLSADARLEGSFTVGTGSFQEVDYYFSYVAIAPNQYVKRKYPVETTVIVEKSTSPHVEVVWTVYKNGLSHFMQSCPCADAKYLYDLKGYRLIVPPGTVIQRYVAN